MEFEQIVKRLDWLDKEQRKQKEALSSLEDHLGSIEVELKAINKKIKQLADEISNISPITARVEQFEATLAQQRIEATNAIDEIEVQHKENHQAIDKRYQMQIDAINKSISDLRKIKETIAEIKRDVKTHTTEETRRDHQLAEWEARMKATVKASEEAQQGMRAA
jgi:chromosome segregation ATPase